MKSRRGSTWSPMRTVKIESDSTASSMRTWRNGIHRRLPELIGVHLAETLVALDVLALLARLERGREDVPQVVDRPLRAVLEGHRERPAGELTNERAGMADQLLPLRARDEGMVDDRLALAAVHRLRAELETEALLLGIVLDDAVDVEPVERRRRPGLRGGELLLERRLVAERRDEHLRGRPLHQRVDHAHVTTALHPIEGLGVLRDPLEVRLQVGLGDRLVLRRRRERDLLRAPLDEERPHRVLVLHVALRLALLHHVERRLRDEDMPALDQLAHLPVEERQEQRPDVTSVDVRIGVVTPPMRTSTEVTSGRCS